MTYQTIQNLRSVWTRKKEYNKLMSLLDYPESRSVALETLVHQTMRSGDESLQIEAIAALATQVDLPRAILDKITALVYRESNLEVRIAAIELLSWYNSHVYIAFHILKDMKSDVDMRIVSWEKFNQGYASRRVFLWWSLYASLTLQEDEDSIFLWSERISSLIAIFVTRTTHLLWMSFFTLV